MRQRIYVAGPYSAPTPRGVHANLDRAIEAAIALIRLGHVPYCPHLSHYLDAAAKALGQPIDYEAWLGQDREWLCLCDAFLYLAPSPGADREREWALCLGLTMYDRLADIPPAEGSSDIPALSGEASPIPVVYQEQQQWGLAVTPLAPE